LYTLRGTAKELLPQTHQGRFNRKSPPLDCVEQESTPLAVRHPPEQLTHIVLGGEGAYMKRVGQSLAQVERRP
jgi:hypothetical protein